MSAATAPRLSCKITELGIPAIIFYLRPAFPRPADLRTFKWLKSQRPLIVKKRWTQPSQPTAPSAANRHASSSARKTANAAYRAASIFPAPAANSSKNCSSRVHPLSTDESYSRIAAQESSPRREPWAFYRNNISPEGAKRDFQAAPISCDATELSLYFFPLTILST